MFNTSGYTLAEALKYRKLPQTTTNHHQIPTNHHKPVENISYHHLKYIYIYILLIQYLSTELSYSLENATYATNPNLILLPLYRPYILSCRISIVLIYYYHHYYNMYYVFEQLKTMELYKKSYKICKEEAIIADISTLSV